MKRNSIWLGLIIASELLFSAQSFGVTDSVEKIGVGAKGFSAKSSGELGWGMKLRYNRYIDDTGLHWGIAGSYGSPSGGALSQDSIAYYGPSLGVDIAMTDAPIIEIDALTGIANGKLDGEKFGPTFFVEPTLSLALVIGSGWRVAFAGGYYFASAKEKLTGAQFGIRLERKTKSSITGMDL
jgi:hypothetical protein